MEINYEHSNIVRVHQLSRQIERSRRRGHEGHLVLSLQRLQTSTSHAARIH